jgi:arylsulfatase A-like enzyme
MMNYSNQNEQEYLRSRNPRPIIAFTSDHGEEFWEHGGFEHGHDYYRETTQVPLILWGTDIPSNKVVNHLVGLIDLGPTLLDLAGVAPVFPDHPEHGISLKGIWDNENAESSPRFSDNNLHNLPSRLVADGPWRYVLRENGQEELYNILEDPKELHNRAHDLAETARRLRNLLEEREKSSAKIANSTDKSQPGAISALKSLGYVN